VIPVRWTADGARHPDPHACDRRRRRDQTIELLRSHATYRVRRRAFPPSKREELALLLGGLTPSLQPASVRLGARMPFRWVTQELAPEAGHHSRSHGATTYQNCRHGLCRFTNASRRTDGRTLPPVPAGARRQLMTVDGAMVPLTHGDWVEVKTVALGASQLPVLHGETVVYLVIELFFAPGGSRDL
jgi:hypothetical protein